jgi:hypothetical protein
VRHFATVVLTTSTGLAATVVLAGCGGGPVPLSSFFKLHVRNDTRRTVTLVFPGHGDPDRMSKGTGVDVYVPRRKDRPGVVLVRVISGRKTLGCLKVPYRKGQQHATALVSAAARCSS